MKSGIAVGSWVWVAALSVAYAGIAAGGCRQPDAETISVRQSATEIAVLVTVVGTDAVPIPGVTVFAETASGSRTWSGTDGEGRAELLVDHGQYRFGAIWDATTYYNGPVTACETPACTSVTITVPKRTVLVTVVDQQGAAVPSAGVVAEKADGSHPVWAEAGPDGRARLLVDDAGYSFYAEEQGTRFYSGASGHCVVPGCAAATITVLSPVLVTVVSTAGVPQPGVTVVAVNPEGAWSGAAATDAAGVARVGLSSGQYRFLVKLDHAFFYSGAPAHCVRPGCNAAQITITEPVILTVVNADGTPRVGQEVSSSTSDNSESQVDFTDAAGRVTLHLVAGHWTFKARCPSWDLYVSPACAVPGCTASQIIMLCDGPGCAGQPNGTACSDGNACTQADACVDGACVGTPSCSSVAVTHTFGGGSAPMAVRASGTLAADRTEAVPGDPATFTVSITNTGMQVDVAPSNPGLTVKNTSDQPFTVRGFRHTLEYFSIAQQAWVPFASYARDNTGAVLPAAPLLANNLQVTVSFDAQPGVTRLPNEPIFGAVIQPQATAKWNPITHVMLTPEVENIIFDPTKTSGLRSVFRFDTSHVPNSPPEAVAVSSADATFATVDGRIHNAAMSVRYGDGPNGPLQPSTTEPLAPGATRTFTGVFPAPPIIPKGVSEPDAAYRARLFGAANTGYHTIRAIPSGTTPRGSVQMTINTTAFAARIPIVAVTKTGPTQAQAGFMTAFGATLRNEGTSIAGPFLLDDAVEGLPVVLTTFTTPPTVAVGQTGAASFQVAIPLERPAGSLTDTVAVRWHDANHNVYGPMSSSFTTSVLPGLFDGRITLAGDLGVPDLLGTTKLLTATVVTPHGNPAAGVAVHLAITGVNARGLDGTTAIDGTVTFAYAGTNLGRDQAVATATVVTNPISSNTANVHWVGADAPPCSGASNPLDIVLIVDNSSSMGPHGKLDAAKAGAKGFIDMLDLTRDQVGVVTFNPPGEMRATLRRSAASLKTLIDGIVIPEFAIGSSDVGLALDTAMLELGSARHNPQATPVLVLLSDGVSVNPGEPAAATMARYEAAIARLDAGPVRGLAMGIGPDIDGPRLRRVATSPSDYFYAPSASDITWAYAHISQDLCRNLPVLVRAGGDQGAYGVRLPHALTLEGEIHDDGPPERLTAEWTKISGPAPVTFGDLHSPITSALFSEPGTYVLQLAASDGFLTSADRATITVDPEPSLEGATLSVALAAPGPLETGATETLTATLLDAQAHPIPSYPLQVTIAGANATTAGVATNAAGVATFSYVGTRTGADVLSATALGIPAVTSSGLSVTWTVPTGGGAVITRGWIGAPAHQATVNGLVPITVADGVTLTSGTVAYWPMSAPDRVKTLATGVNGGPGTTIATLDTTLLANGPYVIRLDAASDAGVTQTSLAAVTVEGDYKPGRVVVEVTDFTIPVQGIPITLGRRYDSLEKDNVGDFGHGWSLTMSHPRLEVDPGHNVTLTMPNGRRSTFYFTPTSILGAHVFLFLYGPAYTPEAGTYGTLTADGCDLLMFNPFVHQTPVCFLDLGGLAYTPTTYKYTDPYGTVFTMAATGELESIEDRNHNRLTFGPDGIVSNAGGGLTVPFLRDAQGRITEIRTPPAGASLLSFHRYQYQYDAAGDLTTVVSFDNNVVTRHTYDGVHRLLTTKDPRGNVVRTSTYDPISGRLATDTDARLNVTSYTYDLATRTTRTKSPDTGVLEQTFDAHGLLLTETDPLGHTTRHAYDDKRNEITRTNALNEVTRFTYDANGNQTSVTQTIDGLDRTTTTLYNAFSQPVTSTDPTGHTTTIDYDDAGLPVRFRDSMGTLATFTSSPHGLPLSVTDVAGKTTYFEYDPFGNLTAKTDRLGRRTTRTYDGIGRVLKITDPRGGVTSHVYNFPANTLLTRTDAAGSVHRFTYDQNENLTFTGITNQAHSELRHYDAINHLLDIEYQDHSKVIYTRDFRGNSLTETDQQDRVTRYTYDLAGQLKKTTFPDGTFTTRDYDLLGRLASTTDERNNTTAYEYEPGCGCSERITRITDPLGHATAMTYDARGRKTSMTDAAGHRTDYAYDGRGRLRETIYADGSTVHDAYDDRGRRTSTTDQTGATTTYGYDDEGQLTSVTDALQHVTQYAYDPAGNLASVTDANNHVTTYDHDLLNRKTKRTLPLGMSETFAYGPTGLVTKHVDFRGKTTTQVYDDFYRLITRLPDPTLGEPTESYTYNPAGTRNTMTDASGTTSYTYDSRDRMLTKATPAGTLTYTYDPAGNVKTVRSSNENGTSVDYAWDEANQLTAVTDNRLGGITSAAYTPTGRPAALAHPNGVSASYSYDLMDRMTSLAWRLGAATTPFASTAYTFNDRGQRRTATDATGRRAAYDYDAVSRLERETITADPSGPAQNGEISYDLDFAGNRRSRTSTLAAIPSATHAYDANDQLASDTYDLNGNTTAADGVTFTYDFRDRLKTKTGGPGGAVTLVYDCDGTRVQKTVGSMTTKYLVDDLSPTGYTQVLEEVSGGVVQARYTYGTSLVGLTMGASSPMTSFYGYDAHGNVVFLTDATGAVTDTYEYDAWGNVVGSTGTTVNTRLYTGEEFDSDLGLLNLRARQYKPSAGRFVTVDPLDKLPSTFASSDLLDALGGSIHSPYDRALFEMAVAQQRSGGGEGLLDPIARHLYIYGNSDPVRFVDPTGLTVAISNARFYTAAEAVRRTAAIMMVAISAVAAPVIVAMNIDEILEQLKKLIGKRINTKDPRFEKCWKDVQRDLVARILDLKSLAINNPAAYRKAFQEAIDKAEEEMRACMAN